MVEKREGGKFLKAQAKILEILRNSDLQGEELHANNALQWLLTLNPHATEEQKLAVLGHDVERGVQPREHQNEGETYDEFKRRHSERSAIIMGKLLWKCGYDQETIGRIAQMVARHETGGDPDSDLVRDADSISYFDVVLPDFLDRKGREKTVTKANWMYSRASERAKCYIRILPLYGAFTSEITE